MKSKMVIGGLPGGLMESGESLEETATREVYEEITNSSVINYSDRILSKMLQIGLLTPLILQHRYLLLY